MTNENYLLGGQYEQLLKGINGKRVNKDGKGFSHVEAYEIRAHLNRIFGFARWSQDVIDQQLIFETDSGGDRPKWTVAYRTIVRLTVCSPDGSALATYTEGAVGDATNQPGRADAHDLALKTSESQALKRCAANLGDQFGLSLYNGGALAPLVIACLVKPAAGVTVVGDEEGAEPTEVDEAVPAVLTPEKAGHVEVEDSREGSSEPPSKAPRSAGTQARTVKQELEDAIATVAQTFEGASEVDDPETEPLGWIIARINSATEQTPAEAMQTLNKALELAVRKQLRTKRMPGGTETIGAVLTRLLASAAKHAGQAS